MWKKLAAFTVLCCGSLVAHEGDYDQEVEALLLKTGNETLSDTFYDLRSHYLQQSGPEWVTAHNEQDYYKAHAESYLDRTLSYIASHLGIIVHGNLDQPALERHLLSFDVYKMLNEAPYENETLSLEAQRLIYHSLIGMPRVIDIHLHNLGYDEDNYLNPSAAAMGVAEWKDYFTFMVLRYAAGMREPLGSTQEARRRLQLYALHFPKLQGHVLPIHAAFARDGKVDWKNTGNYLTNESAALTASSFEGAASKLVAAVSVHPFDPQWWEKIHAAHEQGIRLVKWMPPQSITPDDPSLDTFYRTLALLEMTIIAHAGPEHVIPPNAENGAWADNGNPLRFRRPLQLGVNVILAHSGHEDLIPDLDDPEKKLMPGYQLFMRLAREAYWKNQSGEWRGKVYGDLAAVTTHYDPKMVEELLLFSQEPGARLIYGSDYPYTNLVQPSHDAYEQMVARGLLDRKVVEPLKEIRAWNPLLANYVFTRQLRFKKNGTIVAFPQTTFTGDFKDGPVLP